MYFLCIVVAGRFHFDLEWGLFWTYFSVMPLPHFLLDVRQQNPLEGQLETTRPVPSGRGITLANMTLSKQSKLT